MEMIKRKRGRPKKVKMSDDDLLEEIILKLYNFTYDKDGNIKLVRNGAPLTLEETAFMIWNIEGRKTKHPLSKTHMLNIEHSALNKLRAGLAKFGIKSSDDVFEPKHRLAATRYGETDCPE